MINSGEAPAEADRLRRRSVACLTACMDHGPCGRPVHVWSAAEQVRSYRLRYQRTPAVARQATARMAQTAITAAVTALL